MSRRTGFLLLDRPSREVQTPSPGRDHNGNVSYEYEGVLKVISRSRATLIFSMRVPLVKPQSGLGERVSSC